MAALRSVWSMFLWCACTLVLVLFAIPTPSTGKQHKINSSDLTRVTRVPPLRYTGQTSGTGGSCVNANFTGCCTSGTGCQGAGGLCYCDLLCYSIGDCCSDIAQAGCVNGTVTPSSCQAANYTADSNGCCTSGSCRGVGDTVCYCDQLCYTFNDCCGDLNATGCSPPTATPSPTGACECLLDILMRTD